MAGTAYTKGNHNPPEVTYGHYSILSITYQECSRALPCSSVELFVLNMRTALQVLLAVSFSARKTKLKVKVAIPYIPGWHLNGAVTTHHTAQQH